MPRYTLSTVVQKALHGALEDRVSLLDAYGGHNEGVSEEIVEISRLRGLKFKNLTELTDNQRKAVRLALTYAEQWESGVVDSQGRKSKYGRVAARWEIIFRLYRHTFFGKNGFEEYIENSHIITYGARGWVRKT